MSVCDAIGLYHRLPDCVLQIIPLHLRIFMFYSVHRIKFPRMNSCSLRRIPLRRFGFFQHIFQGIKFNFKFGKIFSRRRTRWNVECFDFEKKESEFLEGYPYFNPLRIFLISFFVSNLAFLLSYSSTGIGCEVTSLLI